VNLRSHMYLHICFSS